LFDHANEFVAWRERQRAFEVWVASAPNEGVGKAGAGGEYLDDPVGHAREHGDRLEAMKREADEDWR
jgi:hypothetical protein